MNNYINFRYPCENNSEPIAMLSQQCEAFFASAVYMCYIISASRFLKIASKRCILDLYIASVQLMPLLNTFSHTMSVAFAMFNLPKWDTTIYFVEPFLGLPKRFAAYTRLLFPLGISTDFVLTGPKRCQILSTDSTMLFMLDTQSQAYGIIPQYYTLDGNTALESMKYFVN